MNAQLSTQRSDSPRGRGVGRRHPISRVLLGLLVLMAVAVANLRTTASLALRQADISPRLMTISSVVHPFQSTGCDRIRIEKTDRSSSSMRERQGDLPLLLDGCYTSPTWNSWLVSKATSVDSEFAWLTVDAPSAAALPAYEARAPPLRS